MAKQKSSAFSILSLTKALAVLDQTIAESNTLWEPKTPKHQQALDAYSNIRQSLPLVSSLMAWASKTAEPLNKILVENGFTIQLQPWPNDGLSVGVVAINDFTVEWRVTGEETKIQNNPAFKLKCEDADVEFLRSHFHRHPIIKIPTKGSDVVFITKYDQAPPTDFALIEAIDTISKRVRFEHTFYDGAIVPMVTLNVQPDISWLVGLEGKSDNDTWTIVQALQQIRFGMNQHGARVVDATAVAATRGGPSFYTIDGPFLIWIERDQVPAPTFMAYISEDDWRNPGNLTSI